MQRTPLVLAATAGAVLTLTALTTAGCGSDSTSAAATTTTAASPTAADTFTVVERALTDTTADTGPTGDSVGDVLSFANPIFNAENTVQLGTDNGSCVRTKVGEAYDCTWTLTVDGGQLMVEGPFYDKSDSVMAITGGTGKYTAARGEMKLHARDAASSAYDFTYSVVD